MKKKSLIFLLIIVFLSGCTEETTTTDNTDNKTGNVIESSIDQIIEELVIIEDASETVITRDFNDNILLINLDSGITIPGTFPYDKMIFPIDSNIIDITEDNGDITVTFETNTEYETLIEVYDEFLVNGTLIDYLSSATIKGDFYNKYLVIRVKDVYAMNIDSEYESIVYITINN